MEEMHWAEGFICFSSSSVYGYNIMSHREANL